MNGRTYRCCAVLLLLGAAAAGAESITVGLPGRCRNLDPQRAFDSASLTVLACLYEGLYEESRGGAVIPVLAATLPQTSDQMQYTIPLATGILFHDGERFDAAAAVFTLNRLLNGSGVFPTRDRFSVILGVEAIDDHTIRVRASVSATELARLLARHECWMLSPATVKRYGDEYGIAVATGTGPFRLSSWERGKRLLLERHEAAGETGGGEEAAAGESRRNVPPPALRRVEFHPYDEGAGMLADILRSRLSIAVEPDITEAADDGYNRRLSVHRIPGRRLVQVYLNNARPPFDVRAVREALHLAVDRDAIAAEVYHGEAAVAAGPIPSWHEDHDSEARVATPDLDRALALLAEAGYNKENPLSFEMLHTGTAAFAKIAAVLRNQLAAAGIEVTLVQVKKNELFDRIYGGRTAPRGSFTAALEDFLDYRDQPDGMQFLADYVSTARTNKCWFTDESFDTLARRYAAMPAGPAARFLLQDMERLVIDRLPGLWLCFPERLVVSKYADMYLGEDGIMRLGRQAK